MTNQELNEAVARKLGWTKCKGNGLPGWHDSKLSQKDCDSGLHSYHSYHKPVPAYSTSIEAAWEIVEHLKEKGIGVDIAHGHPKSAFMTGPGYRCTIVSNLGDWTFSTAETAPRAICEAFLKLP